MTSPRATTLNTIGLVAGPLLALLTYGLASRGGASPALAGTAAVTVWIAVWWMTEAVALAVTAPLPLALFPFLGIMSGAQTAASYFNSTIFLFLGGFILAIAMERWELHRRIALTVLGLVGTEPRRIVLGILLASGIVSMWVSNTAVALLLMPIALAVNRRVEQAMDAPNAARMAPALVMAVAYGASIGGIGSPVGTPPNLVFMRIYGQEFPDAPPISFLRWMVFAVPLMVALLLAAWALLIALYLRGLPRIGGIDLSAERRALGAPSGEELAVMGIFFATVLLWLTRAPIDFGGYAFAGWAALVPGAGRDFIDDGTVAALAALALFLWPSRRGQAGRLLSWDEAQRLPWGIVILFGGGFALAEAIVSSGLSDWFGARLGLLAGLPLIPLIFVAYTLTSGLGELASNTAVAQIVLPIGAAVCIAGGLPPVMLMMPLTMASSLDFILPASTPPNAIALGSGKINVRQLVRTGLMMELVGAVLVTLAMLLYGGRVLGG